MAQRVELPEWLGGRSLRGVDEYPVFFLSKTLDQFLLPPGLFVVLGALLAIGCFRVGRRRLGWLTVVSVSLLWLLSIEPTSRLLLRPLEGWAAGAEHAAIVDASGALEEGDGSHGGATAVEAIVVLGGGTVFPAGNADGELTSTPIARAVRGLELHRATGLPLVYSGGTVFERGRAEAEIGRQFFRTHGVSAGSIRAESESRNTWENARNVAMEFGYRRVYLVTSGYHLRRATYSFEAQGIEVVPVASDYMASRLPYLFVSFLPDHHELYKSGRALHEYLGLLYYRLRYPAEEKGAKTG